MNSALTRALRYAGLSILIGLLLVGLLLIVGYGFVQSESGRQHLLKILNHQLVSSDGTGVHIGGLDGNLLEHVEVHDLRVIDGEGTWLSLQYAGVEWRVWDLLDGIVNLSSLNIEGMVVHRSPENAESDGDGDFRWPGLPVVLLVNQFELGNTVLEQPLIGEEVVFRAVGDTVFNSADLLKSRIEFTRVGDISGQAKLEVSFRPRIQTLGFKLALDEARSGLLARALDMDELPALSIKAAGEGPLNDLNGNVEVLTEHSSLVDTQFNLALEQQPRLELAGEAQMTAIINESLRPFLPGTSSFSLQGQFIETGFILSKGKLVNDLGRLDVSGNLDNYAADFKLALKVDDIHALADITGVSLHGEADIEAHISSGNIREGIEVTLDSELSKVQPLASEWQALVGERVTLRADTEYKTGQPWRFEDITISSEAMELRLNGLLSANQQNVDAEYQIQFHHLAALSQALASPVEGELAINGHIKGELINPALSVQLDSPNLSLDGFNIGAIKGRVKLPQTSGKLAGDVELTIDNPDYGLLKLETLFSLLDEHQLRLDELKAESRGARLLGSASINLVNATVSANMAGDEISLAPWSALAGRPMAGRAGVSVGISNDGKKHSLELAVAGRELDLRLDPKQSLQTKKLNTIIKIDDLLGKPTGAMRLLMTQCSVSDAQLDEVVFEARMNKPDLIQSRLKVQGEIQGPFELEAEADYAIKANGFLLDVSRLAGTMFDLPVTLAGPLQLEQRGDKIRLGKSTFQLAGGQVSANAEIGANEIALKLNAREISIEKIDKLVSKSELSGVVSGDLQISGSRKAPRGDLLLQIVDLHSLPSKANIGSSVSISGELTGKWRDEKLQLNAIFSEVAENKLLADATLPLRLDEKTLLVSLPPDEKIKGRIDWSGELEPLWNLFSQSEDRFSGEGEISLVVEGDMTNPRVSGYFQVTGGHYENLQTTTRLVGVNLRLTGNGDKLVLKNLTAGDGKSGSLSGSGFIELDPTRFYPLDMHLDARDILLVARDDLKLNTSAELSLQGNLSEALLTGEIITGQSELDISGSLPPEIVELEVVEINSESARYSSEVKPATRSSSSRLGLDLQITVPGKSFIRGLGLESEWKGQVKIDGTSEAPKVKGVLSPVRGRYYLMGKLFYLESGTIRFTGSDDMDPILDLTAEHSASRLTALVRITGTASKPEIELTSRPPLPESEIASEVLFGTNSGNLTTAQSLQLASAVTSYNKSSGGLNILDSTRRMLGVDVIGFTDSDDGSNNTRVSVGKYVSEGVFLEVESGSEKNSSTSTTVEIEVMPNVRFEGGTTDTGGSKVGIRWKWDY